MSRLLHDSFEILVATILDLDGIDSAEAVGAPVVAGPLSLDGATSEEAVGAPIVAGPLLVDGVTSEETVDAPSVAFLLALDGISSAEAVGAPSVAGPLLLDGAASEEAVGAPVVAGPLLLDGAASEETVGAPTVAGPLLLDGISSEEAVGAPSVVGPLLLDGVSSEEAVGAPTLTLAGVFLDGIPPGEVGDVAVVGPVYPASIPTAEDVGRVLVFRPADLRLSTTAGPTTGGTRVYLYGGQLNLDDVQDDFDADVVSSIWTDISSGGVVVPTRRKLRLSAASGLAALVSASVLNVDVSATFALPTGDGYAELKLLTGTSSFGFRLYRDSLAITQVASSVVVESVRVPRTASRTTLRILRAADEVRLFVNGRLYATRTWAATSSVVSLAASQCVVDVSDYRRAAVITFGGVPTLDYVPQGQVRGMCTTPAVPATTTTVDVGITGAAGAESTLSQAFTYALPAGLWARGKLTVTNSAVLTLERNG